MAGVTVIVAILAFLLGAASRSACNCCDHYGHVWRKPIDLEDEAAICDRCGERPEDEVIA